MEINGSLKQWLAQSGDHWEMLDNILNMVDALVLILDRQGDVVYFNRTCRKVTGYSFDEVRGRPFFDIFLMPEEKEAVKKVFGQLNSGLFPNRNENYWLTKRRGQTVDRLVQHRLDLGIRGRRLHCRRWTGCDR